VDWLSIEDDLTLSRRSETQDGFQRSRLSRTVTPKQGHDPTLANLQADSLKDVVLTDEGVDVANFKQIFHVRYPPF
jgi:hypothetical protein